MVNFINLSFWLINIDKSFKTLFIKTINVNKCRWCLVKSCKSFIGPTHPMILNVHINTRSGKEVFHTGRMTSNCSKV